jgi:hypothetical protein
MESVTFTKDDCAPYHYAYIELVKKNNINEYLTSQKERYGAILSSIPEERGNEAYAPGKWTIKQVVQHTIDAERIFAFRLLALSRGEKQPIPGFEQDDYVDAVDVTHKSLRALIREFYSVREATNTLMESLTADMLRQRGTISGYPVLAAALPFILAGHIEHHIEILYQRYAVNIEY